MKPNGGGRNSYPFMLVLVVVGDLLFAACGMGAGFSLRFYTALRHIGVEPTGITLTQYVPLMVVGTILLICSYVYLGLYDSKIVLNYKAVSQILIKAGFFWLIAFLSVSFALKFDPQVSRIFVVLSTAATLATMLVWRFGQYLLFAKTALGDNLRQRVAFLGWSVEAAAVADAIAIDKRHAYIVSGVIDIPDETEPMTRIAKPSSLGSAENAEEILRNREIDVLIVSNPNIPRDRLIVFASLCERLYVNFRIIPSFFQIFISGLRLTTISNVPILGVERLRINEDIPRISKRAIDIFGALVGLFLASPIVTVLAILIRLESKGPIFYTQRRTGLNGQTFQIIKLRSMRTDAEAQGAQWAKENDPRRTKIGTFMRRTNLDEVPQFANVLLGQMSLVGPRPERPELIQKFENEIAHYNPRHLVKPGMTGWAQINGLRGDTDLSERVRFDLFYIENWSVVFDFQIMYLTFFRMKNAY